MIIDTHVHLGYDCVWDYEITEQDILDYFKDNGIDAGIVQPFLNRPYIEDTIEIHNRIYRFCSKKPAMLWGMACINPHFRHEDYKKEVQRCIKELGFVGIKLNPQGHATHPASEDGMFVFECAKNLKVPVMVHTGMEGISFSDPVSLLPVLEKYSDVKIILAHSGTDIFIQQAVYIAKKFPNVYLEPSWINVLNLKSIIEQVGVDKVMFSTDDPLNAPVELTKYRTIIKDQEELEKVFSKTAIKVFNLKI